MAGLESLGTYLFGLVLAASAVMGIVLHYYKRKANAHFNKAEARIKHARKMLDEAQTSVKSARRGMRGKADMHVAEAKISKAIADLLSGAEEAQKAAHRR